MGYLLKEALKTLCAVNHWSYAVFWKFGCLNPKLLIWEECYYNLVLPDLPGSGDLGNTSWLSAENCSLQSGEKLHLLVNKMMLDSHVRVLGEGLVGRAAFTGNHQWIIAENCFNEAHPPEVLNEVCQQFSSGIQTIAVIPVLPLGVVQLGSLSKIAENMGFVYDVVSLILQLGSVSSAFLSNGGAVEEAAIKVNPNAVDTSCSFENPTGYSSQASLVNNRTPQMNAAAFHARHQQYPEITPVGSFNYPSSLSLSTRGAAKAEVITMNSDILMNRNSSCPTPRFPPSRFSGNPGCSSAGDGFPIPGIAANPGLIYCSEDGSASFASEVPTGVEPDAHVQPAWGNDLINILGLDYKNQLFNTPSMNSLVNDELAPATHNMQQNRSLACSEMYSVTPEFLESGIFSSNGADDLLEAIVSQVGRSTKPSADDSVSCRTTLTNASSSSVPNSSLPYCQFKTSAGIKGEFFSYAGATSSSSLRNGLSIEEPPVGRSQISSWIENDEKGKQTNSVSTGYSKKPGKPSRKRLKSGENPRPRPKDRQMIQDRIKELREIVPNGSKCSIDALLERTIKHMLFLQSVVKHTDKLKQAGDSKITSEDGASLPRGDIEGGGVTWAYEVGSQSVVCPIRVEDLQQPRQMLIEMICEDRGLFLEIADVVRGLGLIILKGVMESRDDKIWSRFTVEANRDVTRMEIFISLVHLLDQSAKTGTTQSRANDGENQQLHHVPSVPVT